MERMWRKVNQGLISKPSASGKIRGGGGQHQSVAAMLAAQENAAAAAASIGSSSAAASGGAVVSFATDYPGAYQAATRGRMSRSSHRSQHSGTLDAGEQYSLHVRHPSNANGSATSTESRRRRRRKSKTRCNKNNRWVLRP